MDINRKELYRYFGLGSSQPDEQTNKLIDCVLAELEEKVQPKFVYTELTVKCNGSEIILGGESGMNITSRSLSVNLENCERALIFCATLGPAPDLLIKRYSLISMAKAAAVQAAGSAMIEAYCDKIASDFAKRYEGKYFLRPRFSPGYGDFALEHQRDFFRLLNIEKRLGAELSDSLLMIPAKTVTAVIGLAGEQKVCNKPHCADCEKKDCAFRKVQPPCDA